MKRGNHSRSRSSKALVLVLALVLIVGAAVGATFAYLTDSESVENTFTIGNIDIDLEETTGTKYKMIPGQEIAKDPKVTVYKGSEDCWVFVKVDKTAPVGPAASASPDYTFDQFISCTVHSAWTPLPGHDGVYYIEQDAIPDDGTDAVYNVLTGSTTKPDGVVTIPATVTKQMMDNIDGGTAPKLTITAYAIQFAGFADVDAAWHEVSGTTHSSTP